MVSGRGFLPQPAPRDAAPSAERCPGPRAPTTMGWSAEVAEAEDWEVEESCWLAERP